MPFLSPKQQCQRTYLCVFCYEMLLCFVYGTWHSFNSHLPGQPAKFIVKIKVTYFFSEAWGTYAILIYNDKHIYSRYSTAVDLSTNPITIIIIYHFYFARHLQWLQTVAFSLSKCILLKSLQCPVVRWKKSINIIRLIMATMNNCISSDARMDCHIVTTTRLSSDSCIAMAETHRFHRHGSRRGDSPTGMETDVMHSHRDVKMWKYRRILLQCC